ncbi:hypothetical protein BURPS305_2444 [Burkholderia pseudomallei 305]|nr:hypothetical protein BURPS305_2444 [Burkholderia pseudomallei 305]
MAAPQSISINWRAINTTKMRTDAGIMDIRLERTNLRIA